MIQSNFVVNLLFIAIFFTNRIAPAQIALSKTGKITTLPEDDRENVFASQILQIRTTSEATPAATAGSNLNAVRNKVPSSSLNPQKNFQEISSNYEMENRKLTSKETVERGEKNLDFLMQFDESILNEKEPSILLDESTKATNNLPLVSDNCLEMKIKNSEISFTDNGRNLVKISNAAGFISDELQITNDKGHFDIEDENKNNRNAINTNDAFSIENDTNINKNTYSYQNEGHNNDTEKDSTNTVITVDKLLKGPTVSTSTYPADLVPMQPLTTLLYRDVPVTLNVTLFDIVTEKNARTGYGEDWYEVKNRNKIRFGGLPQSENYLIPSLKLEEGFYPFKFMSEFFSLIYPFDFPVGLIKDILWGKFNFPYSFLQSIKVESTFLGFIVFFACIALVIPSYLCILGVMALCSGSRNESDAETGALFPESRETDCSDRVLIFMTLLIVLLCCTLISGMIISNEQAQTAATESRRVIQCACSDIYTWLAAAAREIHHSIVPPAEVVVHAFNEDLMDVERLLGEPIKQAISSESGVDLVLDSLADIVAESEDLSRKISSLRDVSAQASALASVATEKIKDLTRQLDNLKRHCVKADEQLCDTINSHYLELKMKFTLILQEKQLLRLRTLGVVNLTQAIESARNQFRTLPFGISNQTAHIRKDILEHIKQRCNIVHTSSQILRDIARHLTAGLQTTGKRIESGVNRVQKVDFWRWILMLACSFLFSLVMLLIVFATMCGCGNAKIHAKRTLQASSLCLCLTSLILWTVISAIFLFAGHIEVYICHALWDKPNYLALSSLLDRPSPLFTMNEGIFDAIFRDLNNITMDVSVRDVLRDCEMNRPAYIVFQLDKILDVNKETSYFEWDDLQTDFGRLSTTIDVSFLKTTSVNFSKLLNDVLVISDVNLAKYRIDYNGPIVGKDLPSLVDQLENIAAKVSDLNTAGRLETLATRTQRLLISSIRPMEQLRTDLVYKLTELELQLLPFRKKLNISLSHIHTAQYYIDNQGDVIAQKKVSTYISRLISHAASWRTHVLASVGQRAARCRPLYDVYEAARSLLCTRYVASLHGWWVCGFLLGLLWCSILTPLCVRLWRIYRHKISVHDSMALSNINSAQQGTPTTAVCDDNWSSPEPPPPPNEENW